MSVTIQKMMKELKSVLQKVVLGVSVDGQFLNEENEKTLFSEEIKVHFSENNMIVITTDDIPHFYGEGDLELELVQDEYSGELHSTFKDKIVTEIKIYNWKKKGINLFNSGKYLVQIEFYHYDELLLSAGFFYFDKDTRKTECLITGELSVDIQHNLSVKDFEKNLSVVEIK